MEKNLSFLTRRNFLKTTAAGLAAAPALGRGAFAAEPLKVGFIFLGPIGDYGWTWAHNKGRLAMDAALKGQVVSSYVENVKEDASAVPIIKDLAQNGSKLIFTTSYGYMDQTIEVAKLFPQVKFEHCTGYKHADNVGTYNSRFHQGRAVEGTIAGMLSKSGTIGYLGSYKVPEVVLGVNSFTLSAQAVNPNIKTKLVMIDSWFDPAKEAAAVQTLINLGCDVVAQHTDSPAGLQVCEQRKVCASARAPTCHASRRRRRRPASRTSGAPITPRAPGRCSTAHGSRTTPGGASRKAPSSCRPTTRLCRTT